MHDITHDINGTPMTTTQILRTLIDHAPYEPTMEQMLRSIAGEWCGTVPVSDLCEIGEILLMSHVAEQKEQLKEN